jgi:hypothetical protein
MYATNNPRNNPYFISVESLPCLLASLFPQMVLCWASAGRMAWNCGLGARASITSWCVDCEFIMVVLFSFLLCQLSADFFN